MSDREEGPRELPGDELGATALGDSLPGGSATIAGLRIESEIARGGMGIVYKAFDPQLRRWVAVKVISPLLADDDEFRRRFIAESRTVAALDSDRIVPIYNAGEEDGKLFQVTRFMAGGDLATALKGNGPFPPEEAVRVVSQIAEALDTAHQKGAIHRDVKPKNILVDSEGSEPRYYLTDFGLAKPLAASSGITATDQILGTVDYMAPELIENGAIDGRVDVYALGCVAVELLTGYPPFHRDSKQAILLAHLHADPALPLVSGVESQEKLDEVLSQALARDPDARYETCGEFSEALGQVLVPVEDLTGLLSGGIDPRRKQDPSRMRSTLRGSLVGMAVLAAFLLAWTASGLLGTAFGPDRIIKSFADSPSSAGIADQVKTQAREHFSGLVDSDPELSCSQLSSRAKRVIGSAAGASLKGASTLDFCEGAVESERAFKSFGSNFTGSLPPGILPGSSITDRFRGLPALNEKSATRARGWEDPFFRVEFRTMVKQDLFGEKPKPPLTRLRDNATTVAVTFAPADLSPLAVQNGIKALEVTPIYWLVREDGRWLIDAVSFIPNSTVLPTTYGPFPIFPDNWPALQEGPNYTVTGPLE